MSWKSATQPLPKEVNPKLVFERMFSTGPRKQQQERDQRRQSILDFVREDSKSLGRKLGAADNRKLAEYFQSVRDIEARIERSEKLPPVAPPKDFAAPGGVPKSYEDHIRMMCDLMTTLPHQMKCCRDANAEQMLCSMTQLPCQHAH